MNTDIEKIYKWAEDAFQKRNYDYARDMCMQILAIDPDNADTRKLLWSTNKKKITELGAPSGLKLKMKQAKIFAQFMALRNSPAKAAEVAQSHLNEDVTNNKVRMKLAEFLHDANHVGGAITELQIAKENAPNDIPAMKLLGTYLKEMNMIGEAEEVLQRVIGLDPNDREADKMLRDIMALATVRKGMDTATSYRDILKNKSNADELERSHHIFKTEDDIKDDIVDLERDIAAAPKDVKLLKRMGDIHFERKKDYLTAKKWYEKASALNSTDSTLKDLVDDSTIRLMEEEVAKLKAANSPGLSSATAKKTQFQIQSFRRRAADRPTDMAIHFSLGKWLYGDNRIDEAVAEFQMSVKEPKCKVDSHLYLGLCFWRKKIHDIAITQFQKSLEAGIISTEKSMYIRYNMSLCYADAGNIEKALEEGKKIVEVDINFKDISKRVSEWSSQAK